MLRLLHCRLPALRAACFACAATLAVTCASTAQGQGGLSDPTVHTAALNRDPLVQQGFERFYNMDYDGALEIFRKVQEQHPQDPLAVDYVLSDIIFREL